MAQDKERIPIVFSTDRNYFRHVIMSMYSLLKNSSREFMYCFYILSEDELADELAVMRAKLACFDNYELELVKMGEQYAGLTAKVERYKTPTYYRLSLPTILKDYERCIYLDCDIVCVGDVSRIWNEDISGYLLGAVEGHNFTLHEKKHRKRLAWSDAEEFFYVNTGVTLFNLAECRAFGLEEKCAEYLGKGYLYPDQDALNIACRGRIKGLNYSYNIRPYYGGWYDTFISRETELGKEIDRAIEDAVIIHYAAVDKPWINPKVNFGDAWVELALGEDLKELFPEASFFAEHPEIVKLMDKRRIQAHSRVTYRAEIKEKQKEIRRLKNKNQKRLKALKTLKNEKRTLEKENRTLEKEKKALINKNNKLINSKSYRIGKAITCLPRRIKKLLKGLFKKNA